VPCARCPALSRLPRLGPRAPRVRLLGWRVGRGPRRGRLPRRHARRSVSRVTPAATARPVQAAPRPTARKSRSRFTSDASRRMSATEFRRGSISRSFAAVVRRATSTGRTGGPLDASLISGGRSNLTYSVGDDGQRVGAPPAPARPRAADRARHGPRVHRCSPRSPATDVPVPRTLAFCSDER
jgi:hypothetical protein